MSQQMQRVFSFADESEYEIPWENENEDEARRVRYIYAVGAVVVEGEDSLDSMRTALTELREEVSHDRSIANHRERFRVRDAGWHLTEDQITTAAPLWRFMGGSVGIKYHYRFIEAEQKVDGSKLSRVYAVLHAALVRDLVRRYEHGSEIEFTFEEYTGLNSRFARLVRHCSERGERWQGQAPTVAVVSKGSSDLMAVADYMLLGMSRLLGQNEINCEKKKSCSGRCRATLFSKTGPVAGHVKPGNASFRNFENIRTSISSAHRIRLHTGVLSL